MKSRKKAKTVKKIAKKPMAKRSAPKKACKKQGFIEFVKCIFKV